MLKKCYCTDEMFCHQRLGTAVMAIPLQYQEQDLGWLYPSRLEAIRLRSFLIDERHSDVNWTLRPESFRFWVECYSFDMDHYTAIRDRLYREIKLENEFWYNRSTLRLKQTRDEFLGTLFERQAYQNSLVHVRVDRVIQLCVFTKGTKLSPLNRGGENGFVSLCAK